MNDARERLTGFFEALVRRPVAVLMGVLALLGTGAIAGLRIPIELQPEGFASSRIWVNAPWEGANPQEVEQHVLRPLEEELRTVRDVQEILSFASQGSGGVIIAFPGSTDMDMAYAEVADRVERVRPQLPRDVDRLYVRRWTTADTPILWCGVLYPPEDSDDAQDTLVDVLQPRIEAVDGVANVELHGIEPRSVRIWLDEDRVRAQGVDIGALVARLSADNVSQPVGDMDDAGSRFIVRVDGRFKSLEEIENLPIRRGLRIGDVGRVEMVRSAPEGLFRCNGQYGVGLAVTKESSANTFEVCQNLLRLLEEEAPQDPLLGRYEYKVFWNAGKTIYNSLRDLVENAAIGGLIASVVLMLFLRRLRYTLLICLSIPFSVVVTLAYLYFTGDSFNLFSMMGITISIGMLVDNSVVIVESIFTRREQGASLRESVTRGPAEVTLAVITATLTTVVVFLPLIFMSEDRNLRILTTSIAVPLCISLLAALVLAILIVPVAAHYLASRHRRRHADGAPRDGFLSRHFLGLLALSLRHRFFALALAILFFVSGQFAALSSEVRDNFAGFGGELGVSFEFSANTSLAQAEQEIIGIEETLLGPLLDEIGRPTVGIEFSRNDGDINLWYDQDITPAQEKEIRELLKQRLPETAALEYKFEDAFNQQDTEDKKWVRLALEGPESAVVASLADEVRQRAREAEGFAEVADEEDPAREVLLSLDREQMQRLGVTSEAVLGTVEWTLRGFMVSRFETDRADIPIIIEFDEPDEPTTARLAEMEVAAFAIGATVPLGAMSSFEHRFGPRSIFRQDGRTLEVVGLKPKSRDLKEQALTLATLMSDIELPEGYHWKQAGGLTEFEEDQSEVLSAFFLAVALVFFLMGVLFESLLLPLSVLFTIPFAVAGANWSFLLSGVAIDLLGMVGMIVLAGVVVNNGIVLLDRIVSLRKEGMAREEAILRGVRDRIRPVLMTALTTITGLLPIAFSTPTGDGFSFQGLAIGVAGGLTCTTFFTLWVVPLAYTVLDDLGVRLRRIFGVRRRVRAPQAAPGSA